MAQLSVAQFADKIGQLMPAMMKEFARRQADQLFRDDITLPQFLILELLYHEGKFMMTDLARTMRVTTAAMTGIVDRMVRDGYVSRMHNPEDRRIVNIKLTTKGSGLIKRISEDRRKMLVSVFGKVSETDRNNYLRILTRIKDILVKESK